MMDNILISEACARYPCPCKDCTAETGRKVGCHGKCEKYIEWSRKCHEVDAKLDEAMSAVYVVEDYKAYKKFKERV